MAAKSQLHSSNPSCFFSSQSNSPNLKRTRLGGAFKTRNLLVKPIKWGSQQSLSFSYKLGRRQQQRGSGRSSVIKCTAEGIERGILIGGGESREAKLVGERYKVVALLAGVMCLCNADRVVMSVAVVPLAAKFGWSSSFLGIVQKHGKGSVWNLDSTCLTANQVPSHPSVCVNEVGYLSPQKFYIY